MHTKTLPLLPLLFLLACGKAPEACPVGHCVVDVLGICFSVEAICCEDGSGPCPEGMEFTSRPLPAFCAEEPGTCPVDPPPPDGGS